MFPKKWCIQVDNKNIDILSAWVRSHSDYDTNFGIYASRWVISDSGSDKSYQYWGSRCTSEYTEISFEQFKEGILMEKEKKKELKFPRKMLVWDSNEKTAVERIVLTILSKDIKFRIIAIDEDYEQDFKNNDYYDCIAYEHAKELPDVEMTMEEINNHFGRKIKIVEKHG